MIRQVYKKADTCRVSKPVRSRSINLRIMIEIVSYMVAIIFIGDCATLNDFFSGKIHTVRGCQDLKALSNKPILKCGHHSS